MIIFILQNSIILFTTCLLLRQYFTFDNFIDSLLAFAILFYAQIIFILTLLGILNLLYLRNIILVEFIILSILIFIVRREILKSIFKDCYAELLRFPQAINLNKLQIFCLSFILGFGIVKVMINLVNPPFGWDNLNYHFTFPVEWLKHGNLVNPIIVNDYLAPSYFPINGSLIFFWLILPFKSVFLADLGQLPFFVISFLAIFSILKKLEINKFYSLLASILFTITPNYFKQIEIAYIDVIVTALFLSSLNFLLIFYKNLDVKSTILTAISIGMLIGTKITTLPSGAIVFAFFIYLIFYKHRILEKKKALFLSILFIVLVVLFGGFAYLRNYILTNNFFYPLNIKLFGHTILKGVTGIDFPNAANRDFSWGKFLFHEGVGASFIVFVIPGLILATLTIFKIKKFRSYRIFLFSLVPLLYLIYRYLIALPNVRYLYYWLAICYIVAFIGLHEFRISTKIISILVIVCLIVAVSEIAGHLELIISIFISIFLYFVFLYLLKIILNFMLSPMKIITIALVSFVLLNLFFVDYINNEYIRYRQSRKYSGFWPDAIESWIWLNGSTDGNNIAYVGRPVPFPLYGTLFKNNVFYVSVNDKPPYLHAYRNAWYNYGRTYLDFHINLTEPNNYRGNADYGIWLKNLMSQKADYLFVYSLHQVEDIIFPMEDNWASSHPDIFDLTFKNNTVHIYKVIIVGSR